MLAVVWHQPLRASYFLIELGQGTRHEFQIDSVMSAKAQKEKEKASITFKAGDYPGAIGYYTAAILADRKDVTFPLNRAAAYLKLGKYEDAERDCNTVLGLSAKNVKAQFRRGQAKVGLGKFIEAQRDFTEALRLEPDNQATKEELGKVAELIEVEKRKKPGRRQVDVTFDSTIHPTPAPKRRRVPITIIEPPASPGKEPVAEVEQSEPTPVAAKLAEKPLKSISAPGNVNIQESSTHPLKVSPPPLKPQPEPQQTAGKSSPSAAAAPSEPTASNPSLPSTPSTAPKASSFAEAKQAREAKISKVGGGIFRASGQNTVFPARTTSPPAASPPKETPAASVAKSQGGEIPASVKESSPSSPQQSQSTPEATLSPKPESRSSVAPVPESKPLSTAPSHESVRSPVNGSVSNQPPATLFDFNRTWRSMLTSVERWKLLQTIPPVNMPSFCKTSLEPTLLVSILEVFLVILSSLPTVDDVTKIGEYMEYLARVPRFPTLIMFLSSREKTVAKEVWRKLGLQGSAPGTWNALGSLSS
ncbi:hypothetical protein P691DRAFT_755755 [Macrolepiota fuliginosa MF-IS2]|uniref:RNA polymerase II-associated protein 3 n=1 Tax=Macrolepiota fuliginosa MF-IS2 TaxID=1400762 RepID=A0A9P5XPZ4_9AGAR|nr:hypothetical protein P691DRAFT_755755 [Macrolepiota fuliginosa MF-IS2]